MANKLHHLLSALKHKATDIAVLRATSHHPSSIPPSPCHVAALLSFGHSSRLSASTLVHSLTSRLSSARHPAVALKSLLCIHRLLNHASFILVDALTFSLLPSSGRRSPLNFSSFKHPTSLALSSWVRWYARLIELLLTAKAFGKSKEADDIHRLTSLLNGELVVELGSLVGVVEEIDRAPAGELMTATQGNELVREVVRLAEEERVNMQQGIRVRVQEVRERVEELGFGDSVEVSCLLRRLEEYCRDHCELSWMREVREVREGVERRGGEERERKVISRDRVGESARVSDQRVRDGDHELRFGSCRWIKS